ncbi:hypothetical protein HN385_05265 [archaeon]|jgi:hypothetical protein|nr:hypothetical protein [archaeon]MBT3451522.1 hypothetical protein [archaeon]MBT6869508.1 hypothetical protein [archaeon]MBT7193196.1 hypothetical protein [archaeon]MBT7380502.1 hypothetical protein [archaeon]
MVKELDKISSGTKRTMDLFAAEYNEAKELKEELGRISNEDVDKAIKDVNRALRVLRWIGRAQWRASRSEKKLKHNIADLIKLLPPDQKNKLLKLLNQLEIADAKLTRAASMFTGDLRQELLQIKTYEELRSKKGGSESERLTPKLKRLISDAKEGVDEIITWIGSVEVILKNIEQMETALEKMVA